MFAETGFYDTSQNKLNILTWKGLFFLSKKKKTKWRKYFNAKVLKKSKELRKKHLKEETTKNTYSNGYYEYRSYLLVFEKQNSLLSKDFKRFHWNNLKSRNILHPIMRKSYLLSLIVCLSCIQLERPRRDGHNPSEAEYDIEADLKYH